MQAQEEYLKANSEGKTENGAMKHQAMRESLLKYCGCDRLAMVKIYKMLNVNQNHI